jgi:hypothetical protein
MIAIDTTFRVEIRFEPSVMDLLLAVRGCADSKAESGDFVEVMEGNPALLTVLTPRYKTAFEVESAVTDLITRKGGRIL